MSGTTVSLGSAALHAEASICSHFHARAGISARVARPSAPCCSLKNYRNRSYNPCRIDTSRFPFPRSFAAFSSENAACFPLSHKPPTRASGKAFSNFSTAKMYSPAWSPRSKPSAPSLPTSTRIAMAWSPRGRLHLRGSLFPYPHLRLTDSRTSKSVSDTYS